MRNLIQEYMVSSQYYAPRGRERLMFLGEQIAQKHLHYSDSLIGIVGDAGSGKSSLINGMFPGLELSNDNLILCGAIEASKSREITFITDDLLLRLMALSHGLEVKCYADILGGDEPLYLGYKTVTLFENEMVDLYSNIKDNTYGCLDNEYLLIKNADEEIIDIRKWTVENGYIDINTKSFKSSFLGTVKPLDEIQKCAFDSINTNEMTLLFGRAGSGKTTLPLAYIMQGLESQKFKKAHIIYHYETLKDAKTLGYEKGSHLEKILNTGSIAGILNSKLKDVSYVLETFGNRLEIIPTANLRGVEFGSEDLVFCTECQDINPYTLKTIIQRCKSGCKQIYEGDMLEQSDVKMQIKGMERLIDVFKGYKNFGCIKLKNNYRSEICELADMM